MIFSDAVMIIPSLQPDDCLTVLVSQLKDIGFDRIVIVDDGSGADYADKFSAAEDMGCVVVRHEKNFGKGKAIQTGIKAAAEHFPDRLGYITADSDGQHDPQDILKVAQKLAECPDSLILGARDFSEESVPARSIVGNRLSSFYFRLTTGQKCPDTQTGLRGIPLCLEKTSLTTEGSRYEYEMNFLVDAADITDIVSVPIRTIYMNDNRSSHFRPIKDSLRIYGRFIRFTIASLIGAATDLLVFWLLSLLLTALTKDGMIVVATVAARICSGIVNYVVNKLWSFRSKNPVKTEILRYGILFICQMAASAALVTLISLTNIPVIVVKIIVDTFLFFISYIIQKKWVFRKEDKRSGEK